MDIPRTNLDALQSFAVFADTLNFSESARLLHISQPALHAKVRKLSEQLDAKLYVRVGSALALTGAGEQVARHARELLTLNQRFVKGLAAGHDTPAVTLAAGEGAYLYLLGKALSQFSGPAASPHLHLLTRNRDEAVRAVRAGQAQLGIAPLGTVPADLHAVRLTAVGQVLVVPRGHALAARKSVRLRDLKGAQLVVPPAGRPHRELLGRLLQAESVPWQPSLEADGWELMLRFAQLGFGLTVVNACCRIPKGLVAVPLQGYPPLDYHLFHAADRPPATHVLRLWNALLAHGDHWKTT
ncbi:LysR family transcriptional regulator [Variovorax sp. J22G73]|jgi:DNA-binding transcriptional LysR family regulator|uniref:LysR family transcriptional regulator n=1 Tax=unclassified Variovorax TaxID=663243 RepID=UPI000D5FD968|nr:MULTISPECIES: LysR family transcriptional regulator [unclassified Variovorax]MDM0010367.1 LysR family transcriptional regulator [Variovorax sp. J22R203]MDM0102763.1 LysR family transcriptional regulator [Variovorax sp. J22G73]